MNDPNRRSEPRRQLRIPVLQQKKIDRICRAFRARWRVEAGLRIEDCLDRVEVTLRTALLSELIAAEIDLLRAAGEDVVRDDYAARFPSDQNTFLDRALDGLTLDGKIICVRLALFADMLKGKPWSRTTLKQMGGMAGLGKRFLEETFSAPTAPSAHRHHQNAIQRVLRAFLSSDDTRLITFLIGGGNNATDLSGIYDDFRHGCGFARGGATTGMDPFCGPGSARIQ